MRNAAEPSRWPARRQNRREQTGGSGKKSNGKCLDGEVVSHLLGTEEISGPIPDPGSLGYKCQFASWLAASYMFRFTTDGSIEE